MRVEFTQMQRAEVRLALQNRIIDLIERIERASFPIADIRQWLMAAYGAYLLVGGYDAYFSEAERAIIWDVMKDALE